MTVSSKHEQYTKMIPSWKLMDDVTANEKHMHEQGEEYVPKLDKMSDTQYAAYVKRGNFPLYTKHVLNNFTGMSMRKDVMLTGIPEPLENNVDSKGSNITKYTKNLVKQFLKYSRCGTLIEYGNSSKKAKLVFYNHLSIINWKTRVINDIEQLSLVVLQEHIDADDDEFSDAKKIQYRVLSLDSTTNKYQQRIFDKDEKLVGEVIFPTSFHKELEFIPFVMHGGINVEYPVLLPIAEQNIAYYRLDVDYKHGLHYVALPTPYTTGVDANDPNKPTVIGPTEVWHLPEGASAGMLEFTGKGLGEIATAMDKVDDNIILLSSRVLAPPKTINETATAAAIRNAGETSSLAEVVGMLSMEMSLCMSMAIKWTNEVVKDVIKVTINNDFIPTILSGADVASYVASHLKDGLSYKTLFTTLKKGEIVEGDRSLEDELRDIKSERAERMALQITLAKELGKIEVTQEPAKKEPIKQGKEGEQVNKGKLKEN